MERIESRRRFSLTVIVVVILVVASFVLIMPSARAGRRVKELASLRSRYPELAAVEVKGYEKAHWITSGNNYQPIRTDEAALRFVWAPTGSEAKPCLALDYFCATSYGMNRVSPLKHALLVAPSKDNPALELLGKVCLSTFYTRRNYTSLQNLAAVMEQSPLRAMPALESAWSWVPKDLQVRIEKEIEENRRIIAEVKIKQGFFQTGEGHFFGFGDGRGDDFQELDGSFDFLPAAK